MKIILRKWWVLILQGILLIILSVYCWNNPNDVLKGISIWFGLLTIIAGIIGLIHYFWDKTDREQTTLIWSLTTTFFGILMLFHMVVTMKLITIFFGLWIVLGGGQLIKNGWELKTQNQLGWLMIILGVLTFITGLMMIFHIDFGAIGISTLLGIQLFFAGLGLIVFGIIKKAGLSNIN